MTIQPLSGRPQADSLADVLERVLDKGVVIAGDVVVNVLDIELLSLKLRLFIASAQTAREMGMDWWTKDSFYTTQDGGDDETLRRRSVRRGDRRQELSGEQDDLRQRIESLEHALAASHKSQSRSSAADGNDGEARK